MCGIWHLPQILFRGIINLMNIASLMVLVMPWDSLLTMEKLSNLMYGVCTYFQAHNDKLVKISHASVIDFMQTIGQSHWYVMNIVNFWDAHHTLGLVSNS